MYNVTSFCIILNLEGKEIGTQVSLAVSVSKLRLNVSAMIHLHMEGPSLWFSGRAPCKMLVTLV